MLMRVSRTSVLLTMVVKEGMRVGYLRFPGGWYLREEKACCCRVGTQESSRFPKMAETLVYSRKYPKACVTGAQSSERRFEVKRGC